jgi:tRNA(fMet)-specific endonuclease VapC
LSLIFLLDTNVVSEPLRPAPNQHVLERLKQHEAEIAIATVVWHELLYGTYRLPHSAKRSTIEEYLSEVVAPTFPILPYDVQAAQWHAAERARLVGLGHTPPFADGQIAAIAQVNNLILVTANTADFSMYQDLQVENWHKISGGR